MPRQEAILNLSLTEEVEIVGGSYCYNLPGSLFPDYKKHTMKKRRYRDLWHRDAWNEQKMGDITKLESTYTINYVFNLMSSQKITYLSVPKGASAVFNEDRTQATLKGNKASRVLKFFYRSGQMMRPRLLFEESAKFPEEVAVSASFVPTFEPPQPQEECEVLQDEQPESTSLTNGSDFFFVFIVDRSGSMGGKRIEVTKEAMKLFMRSLPSGCKFQVLSFGSKYTSMALPPEDPKVKSR